MLEPWRFSDRSVLRITSHRRPRRATVSVCPPPGDGTEGVPLQSGMWPTPQRPSAPHVKPRLTQETYEGMVTRGLAAWRDAFWRPVSGLNNAKSLDDYYLPYDFLMRFFPYRPLWGYSAPLYLSSLIFLSFHLTAHWFPLYLSLWSAFLKSVLPQPVGASASPLENDSSSPNWGFCCKISCLVVKRRSRLRKGSWDSRGNDVVF